MPEKTCMICSQKISLSNNLSGLVFDDKHFICEDCCATRSSNDIQNFTRTIMQTPDTGMPIALWLIHEQNRDKQLMVSIKK